MQSRQRWDVDREDGIRVLSRTDLWGKGDGGQVVVHGNHAYVGHMGVGNGEGTSIIDVSDPRRPVQVNQLTVPPGTRSHKVQVVDDLMLVNHEYNRLGPASTTWSAGLALYDVSDPAQPVQTGFLEIPGIGVHRTSFTELPYAYVTGSDEGFDEQIFIVVDVSDPTSPREVGRWWLPGMKEGEKPGRPSAGRRISHHHSIVRGDRAYGGWWDAGLVILDVSDKTSPELVAHVDFPDEISGATHTALPLVSRDALVVVDEAIRPPGMPFREKFVRIMDVSDDSDPQLLSVLPNPTHEYEDFPEKIGPHNVHEMTPGSWTDENEIYVSYFGAGVRVFDISDLRNPREVASCIPAAPPAGDKPIQINDLFVDVGGLIYATDRYSGGMYVMERG